MSSTVRSLKVNVSWAFPSALAGVPVDVLVVVAELADVAGMIAVTGLVLVVVVSELVVMACAVAPYGKQKVKQMSTLTSL